MNKKYKKQLVLLVNLGSPAQLSVAAIRVFLRDFLSDKRVVGLPRWLWYPILYGIILPIRAKKLLHKYKLIWRDDGLSPLSYYTKCQAEKLAVCCDGNTVVDYAFCYGDNTIKERLMHLEAQYHFDSLVVIPLYPQYSSSTSAVVFDQVTNYYSRKYYIPSISYVTSFADHAAYIQLLANSVRHHWDINGRADKLLLSFHSIPVALVDSGDTYVAECELTRELLCKSLGLTPSDVLIAYQSKFGRAKWVEPATDAVIKQLAKSTSSIDVICPGFVSDCLETLEEVAIQYRDLYISHGGQKLCYIPCINDNPTFGGVLSELIKQN